MRLRARPYFTDPDVRALIDQATQDHFDAMYARPSRRTRTPTAHT